MRLSSVTFVCKSFRLQSATCGRGNMDVLGFQPSLLLLLSLWGKPLACTQLASNRRGGKLHFVFQRRQFPRQLWKARAWRRVSRSAATWRWTGCVSLRRPSVSATLRVESTATVARILTNSAHLVRPAHAPRACGSVSTVHRKG